MAATEQLKVKITADASQAQTEIKKLKNALKGTAGTASESNSSMKALNSTMRDLRAAVRGDLGAMANLPTTLKKVAIAGAALLATIKAIKWQISNALQVAEMGDEIKDNAQKVFMGTAAYQEWGYVLKQNGVDIKALKMGMRQFAQHVAAGDETLKKYGITAKNVDEAFEQAIYTIQNMSTETEKIAAATELFGTRALELFPILNLTNQETQNLMQSYRLLGGTMSNELIALSDVCADSIYNMKVAWGGLKNTLAQLLLPTIIKIVQWLTILMAKVRMVLAAIFGIKASYGNANKKNSVAGASASTAKSTGGTAKNLGKAAKHAKELKRTLMGIDELSRLAEKATSAAGGGSGGGGGVGGVGDVGGGDLGMMEDLLSPEMMQKLETFQQKVESVKGILNGLYEVLKGIVTIFVKGDIRTGIDLIKSGLGKIWDNLKDIFPKLQNVKSAWSDIKSKTATLKLTLSDAFSKAWNKIKKAWNGIKTKTATVKLAFTEGIKNKWNAIATKINAARNKSAFARTVLPAMPLLAKGGVLTSPIAAVMGEYPGARQNPEIATPQSLMYETIQRANGDLVSAFATMTRQVIAAIEDKDLTVSIGDEQIARSAQRGNTAYKSRTGKALLTI